MSRLTERDFQTKMDDAAELKENSSQIRLNIFLIASFNVCGAFFYAFLI